MDIEKVKVFTTYLNKYLKLREGIKDDYISDNFKNILGLVDYRNSKTEDTIELQLKDLDEYLKKIFEKFIPEICNVEFKIK